MSTPYRVGFGYDVHRLVEGRPLILGGVSIPFGGRGLLGHSDADVLLHAITDALLGAAALGDIGTHFPPTDMRWKDADSGDLLAQSVQLLANAGWRPVNMDCTVVCEEPKIGPYRAAISERIAALLGVAVGMVNVKGKTSEGMGFTGTGEGMAAYAIALVEPSREG